MAALDPSEALSPGALAAPGTAQPERDDPRRLPGSAPLDNRSADELLDSLRTLAGLVRLYRRDPDDAQGDTLAPLLPAGGVAELEQQAIQGGGQMPPHHALLLAFLRQLAQPQALLNRFTAEHLEVQLKRVLGFVPQPLQPDRAHLLLTLKKGATPLVLPAGQRFSAGKDAQGRALQYAPVRRSVVGQARLAQVMSVSRAGRRLWWAPVADSADGLGAPLTSSQPGWAPFARAPAAAPATVGFAVASPLLRLAEGERQVTVALRLAHWPRGVDAAALSRSLRVRLSSPKGWSGPWPVQASLEAVAAAPGLRGRALRRAEVWLTLTTALPADAAPVSDHQPAIHQQAFPAGLPVWQCLLQPAAEGDSGLQPGDLAAVTVLQARVEVRARGLRELTLENDDSVLNPKKACLPFGAQPVTGARLLIGCAEALAKPLSSMTLHFHWQGAPADLQAWYDGYRRRAGLAGGVGATASWRDAAGTARHTQVFTLLPRLAGPTTLVLSAAGQAQVQGTGGAHVFDRIEALWRSGSPLAQTHALGQGLATGLRPAWPGGLGGSSFRSPFGSPFGSSFGSPFGSPFGARSGMPSAFGIGHAVSSDAGQAHLAGQGVVHFGAAGHGKRRDEVVAKTALAVEERDRLVAAQERVMPPAGAIAIELADDLLHADYRHDAMAAATPPAGATNFTPKVLNPPYAPKLQSLSLDYEARSDDSDLSVPTETAFTQTAVQFFQVDVAGVSREHAWLQQQRPWRQGALAVHLLPEHEAAGELYLGLDGVEPGASLSMLMQLVEGSANPQATPEAVQWSLLSGDDWRPLGPGELALDTTDQLRRSGLIGLTLPSSLPTRHLRLPTGLVWLRASVAQQADAVCDLLGVHPNAVEVAWVDPGGDAGAHLAAPLPAGAITKAEPALASVKTLLQPYASWGGQPAEADEALARRAAERLRHRQRAVTPWDIERLVLQAFPAVYRVQCLPHASDTSFVAAGHLSVVVVPDLRGRQPSHPLQPRVDLDTLARIQAFVEAHAHPEARVHVRNPVYREVQVAFGLRLRDGFGWADTAPAVEQALREALSPWAVDGPARLGFGARVLRSAVLALVESLPGVDYVSDFRLGLVGGPADAAELIPDRPDAILVSAASHVLRDLRAEGA